MSKPIQDLHVVLVRGLKLLTDRAEELESSLARAQKLLDEALAATEGQNRIIEAQIKTIEGLMEERGIGIPKK